MSAKLRIELCGAFNASVTLRDGETVEQAAQRAESTLQRVLDTYAARLDCRIGVDMGELPEDAS